MSILEKNSDLLDRFFVRKRLTLPSGMSGRMNHRAKCPATNNRTTAKNGRKAAIQNWSLIGVSQGWCGPDYPPRS